MREKVERLIQLLQVSNRTIIYSGAGISSAAGIAPAARTGSQLNDLTTDAEPTITHRALAQLRKAGLVTDWIQQNHDGQSDLLHFTSYWNLMIRVTTEGRLPSRGRG